MKFILIFTILFMFVLTSCSGGGNTAQLTTSISSNEEASSDIVFSFEVSESTQISTYAIHDSDAPPSQRPGDSSEKSSTASYTIDLNQINTSFSQFQSALKNTSRQKLYALTSDCTLKIGSVDILKILKQEQTALADSQQIYFTAVERIEKSEAAAPLGRSLSQTYFDGQTAHIRIQFEDTQSPENSYDKIITNTGSSAELEPVPYNYLNINKSYIIAADTTASGDKTEFAFTLDPEKSRQLLANTLNSDEFGLEIDINDINIEYNIINAAADSNQNIISLSQTIKFSIGPKISTYTNQYTYTNLGTNAQVKRPDWVK